MNTFTDLHPRWVTLTQGAKLKILLREIGVRRTALVILWRIMQRIGAPISFLRASGIRNTVAYVAMVSLNRLIRVRVDRYRRPLAKVGNKILDTSLLGKDSTVYSFGVGTYIQFDLELCELAGCQVFLFDPTPRSIEFMKRQTDHDLLHFEPIGIWTENSEMKFFIDYTPGGKNCSITNLFRTEDYFLAECKTLRRVMADNGHDKVDVLKIDIEGAAIPVLSSIIADGIRPEQICAEFELPGVLWGEPFSSVMHFFRDRKRLMDQFRLAGYKLVYFDGAEGTLVRQ